MVNDLNSIRVITSNVKLWIGAEIEADIADSFREARRVVETSINGAIVGNDYSLPFSDWDCIAIVRNDDVFGEITEYSPETEEMDFRLKLDYKTFKLSSKENREKMIYDMLARSLSILIGMNVSGAGFERLLSDVVAVGRAHGWLR